MATKALVSWALALQHSSIPSSVHDIAVKSIYNWAGCATGGYLQPAPGLAYNATSSFVPENSNSTILGTDVVVDVQTAALINGIASHADDHDGTHRDNPIHPSGPVFSARLAVAEWKGAVSGPDLLTAFVPGVEAECKLGVSVFPEHYNNITSTVGSIDAAVAVGKILDLELEELQKAISIAAIQVTGMHDSFGTDAKPFHVGRAAQNGLMAALLAKNGFSASLEGPEAERGWIHVVSTRENTTAEFDTLGEVWEIESNTFKPFPCDRIIHAAIDGWIQIRQLALEQNLDILSITNVTARTHPRVLFLTDDPEPTTGLEGKFSVYHTAAIALLYGEATPSQFTDDVVQNSTVIGLREKVHVTSDDTVEEHEAFVSATFEDGTTLEYHVEHTIGSYENPLTAEQLKVKFLDQVGTAIGDSRAEQAWVTFSTIANATHVGEAVRLYRGEAKTSG
ncbi:MmgE/PrpD family protein [Colletotrichum sojae]|uniref:MmgE/PrpD family protein n=1 Tax=Colletotrichum sojae TaxID=2175907 RepID=A0A8H6IVE4_9PEZI|nr:MmgE/PrpD family protein [Colletotrichum sojae]